jgi:hypothetical protein
LAHLLLLLSAVVSLPACGKAWDTGSSNAMSKWVVEGRIVAVDDIGRLVRMMNAADVLLSYLSRQSMVIYLKA